MKSFFLSFLLILSFTSVAPTMVRAQVSNDSTDVNTRPNTIPGQIGVPTSRPVNTGADVTASRDVVTQRTASSCSTIKLKSLLDVMIWLKCIAVDILIPLIFAAAFVVFLWGVLRFMYSAGDMAKRKEAKRLVWFGMVGLFVMVGIWGIISIVNKTLGINTTTVPLLQTTYLDPKKASR